MTSASIPVDLINPGQVLASLGFLETADALCSGAVGGFDWTNEADVRFNLHARGDRNPFERVLEFLSGAELRRIAPSGYKDPPKKKRKQSEEDDEDVRGNDLIHLDCFPGEAADVMTLPVRLTLDNQSVDVTHWADGSSRDTFKLYTGNRSAATVAEAMLTATRTLWNKNSACLIGNPFHILTPMGGSFNFDPRGAWTGLDVGYSPDKQKHRISASPIVEILAAIGLEHARPVIARDESGISARYAAWGELLSPLLARPALSGCGFGVSLRRFVFKVGFKGRNKFVNFAEEEG